MTELDKIKANAFEKLDEFVKGELQYLVDNNYPLKMFSMENMLSDHLTENEKREVNNSIQQLKEGAVKFYCKCRGIDIPKQLLLVKESNGKEPQKTNKELLTSKRTLNPGQKILND